MGNEITYEWLRHIIQSKKLTNLNETIAALPEELRASYVLMYSSGSTQLAAFNKPRVLLFTSDARFILAFNDIPDARGRRRLEVVQFRDDLDTFEFYDIRFNADPAAPDKGAFFSEKNPFICSKCHYDDMRPNWDPFPITIGAFGSSDDRIFQGSKEDEGFRDYIRANDREPYKYLASLKVVEEPGGVSYRLSSLPNRTFGTALNKLNLRRIRRILMDNPHYNSIRYAISAALDPHCSATFGGFVSSTALRSSEAAFEESCAFTLRRRHQYARDLRRSAAQFAGVEPHRMADPAPLLEKDDRQTGALRFLVEGPMRSSMLDWAMTREADSFIFTAAEQGIDSLGQMLRADLLKDHPELVSMQSEAFCQELAMLGRKALAGNEGSSDKMEVFNESELLSSCMGCHTGEAPVGPALPFDQPERLKLSLLKPMPYSRAPDGGVWRLLDEIIYRINSIGSDLVMPKGRPLSERRREALEIHLRSLAKGE